MRSGVYDKHEGKLPVYCIKHEDSHAIYNLCVLYHDDPLPNHASRPCNKYDCM